MNQTVSIVIKPPDVMDITIFDTVTQRLWLQICIQFTFWMNETFQDSLLAVNPKQRLWMQPSSTSITD